MLWLKTSLLLFAWAPMGAHGIIFDRFRGGIRLFLLKSVELATKSGYNYQKMSNASARIATLGRQTA